MTVAVKLPTMYCGRFGHPVAPQWNRLQRRVPCKSDRSGKASVFAAEGLTSEKRLFSEASHPWTRPRACSPAYRSLTSWKTATGLPPARSDPQRRADRPGASDVLYGSMTWSTPGGKQRGPDAGRTRPSKGRLPRLSGPVRPAVRPVRRVASGSAPPIRIPLQPAAGPSHSPCRCGRSPRAAAYLGAVRASTNRPAAANVLVTRFR